jgi:serine/threonine-protein kinase
VRPGSAEALRRQLVRLRESLQKAAAAKVAEVEARPIAKPMEPLQPPAVTPPTPTPPAPPLPAEPSTDVVAKPGMTSVTRRLVYAGVGAMVLGLVLGLFFALRAPTPTPEPVVKVTPTPPPAVVQPQQPTPTPPSPVTPPDTAPTVEATPKPSVPEQGSATATEPPKSTGTVVTSPGTTKDKGKTIPVVAEETAESPKGRKGFRCPNRKALSSDIEGLQRALTKQISLGASPSPAAQAMLEDLRSKLREAGTVRDCNEVAEGIEGFRVMALKITKGP